MNKDKYKHENKTRKHKMVVRLTQTEYELDDGTVHPLIFEFDELPTLEEFQNIYKEWEVIFHDKNLITCKGDNE